MAKSWPVIKSNVIALFWLSITQEKLLKRWKIAKIISLKKPQKDNYIHPKSFKLITLSPTLSKALELVIA